MAQQATGAASEAALRAGAWVIANDLDAAPLMDLERRVRRDYGESEQARLLVQRRR